MFGVDGLTKLSTKDLRQALRMVHRGELTVPLTVEGITRCGLQHVATELLRELRGLDDRAMRAVLVCVLAERLGQRSVAEDLPGRVARR